ncbi:MAG: hypothetical protein H0W83_14365 [Planctomycetes bacterium]|nr:hypothetical protein [Planctomycetota bacterium]
MLILLLRIIFVLLAVLVFMTSGQYWYRGVMEGHMPPWFGGALGFGVAITLIAAEQAFRRRFARTVVALLVGLGAGLALAYLLLQVMRLVLQDDEMYRNLDLPLALVTIYLVLMTVMRNIDRWRVVIPFVEFRAERIELGSMVLDATILADGRLPALLKTGLFPYRLLVHRQVLSRLEAATHAADPAEVARATRALDGLKEIRALGSPPVEIDETDIPNARDLSDVLVRLCRLESAMLLAGDRELVRMAEAEGVSVVDLTALATVLTPATKPGDVVSVTIEKAGEGKGQGIGFLGDGSMVVVNGGLEKLGEQVRATVLRTHATSNGRMVFTDLLK